MKMIAMFLRFLSRLLSDESTDMKILAALQERAKYGVELYDDTRCSFGRLYPALNRLEKLGLIGSCWDEVSRAERGGARRKYYYLKRQL